MAALSQHRRHTGTHTEHRTLLESAAATRDPWLERDAPAAPTRSSHWLPALMALALALALALLFLFRRWRLQLV